MHQPLNISSDVLLNANYNSEQLHASVVGNTRNIDDPNISSKPLLFIAIHIAKGDTVLELRLNTANLISQRLSIAVPIGIDMH